MGKTMTQKILMRHCKSAGAGELIEADLDLILGNDITAPVAIEEFESFGFNKVFDKNKIALVLDHFTPCKDIKSAQLCKTVRKFAKKHEISNFFDVGEAGIEHALLPEKGLVLPGSVIIGADSHTCTYGALNAFATGIGSTDMAAGMASGKCWFRIPQAIKVEISGSFNRYVSGKDVVLHLIGEIGVDGALYKSLEFAGDIFKLSIDDRFTIANMAIEAGAKNGIFPFDDITKEYLCGRTNRDFEPVYPDDDAEYVQTIKINLSELKPTVAKPFSPGNVQTVETLDKTRIDQAVIGSCTNGRISDLRIAAQILKGNKTSDDVRTLIIPATQEIYLQAIEEGLIEIFIKAGCAVSTPTCGPCLGGHMGILGEDEVCISTTNRNFVGRMGHKTSKVYLASPAVCAMSAINGYISEP